MHYRGPISTAFSKNLKILKKCSIQNGTVKVIYLCNFFDDLIQSWFLLVAYLTLANLSLTWKHGLLLGLN